jgi:predicted RNase H-like HicB family nuclease
MKPKFTACFRREGKWIAAYVEEIPGVNTQGRTMAEARANLHDALRLVMAANRAMARKQRGRVMAREPIELSA